MTKMYVVRDPSGVPDLTITDPDWFVYMGTNLVKYVRDDVAGDDTLYVVGTDAAVFDEADWTILATRHDASTVPVAIAAIEDMVVVLLTVDDGGGGSKVVYWLVTSAGVATVADGDTVTEIQRLDGVRLLIDQRVSAQLRTAYFGDVNENLKPLPTGVSGGTIFDGDPDQDWNRATTWAAFILGDNTTEATQPDPPDPFDITLTSVGHHTSDHQIVFNFHYDTAPFFTNWTESTIEVAAGSPPAGLIVDFGLYHVETVATSLPINGGPTDTGIGSAGPYASGYLIDYDPDDDLAVTGVPAVFLNVTADPGLPDDVLDGLTATLSSTQTITPTAPLVFRRGEYRYLNSRLDETSNYAVGSDFGAPGTEWMKSDFIDTPVGRWTAVVSLIQTSDESGGGTQWAVCTHFEPFGRAILPPLRMYPREDALGASSTTRLWPPPRSIQASRRRAGGYT